ncbi:hypothetical protein SUGI_0143240 [Cryptomeria japonica]|nr:hypothetical protein SUGI_0143240 [Cryptomeria japonica]
MGFHVFLDLEALEPGDSFPSELQHAIASANLHIAIFSPNYAQSPWCLAELSFMLKSGKKIIPIFYHVEPSDLRYVDQGKGKYASAFSEHEEKRRYTQERLDVWKRALCDSSFLHGYTVSDNKDEATVLKTVVTCVLQIIKKDPLWVADHPVRLDDLVKGFESVATGENVKIRGIVGMGGSGKTTLAKELYNKNFSSFERCSFVSDVRDAASRNAMCEKQKKLLADLGVHHLPFDNVDEGKAILANRLSSHRALIVLDDVDHIDQLNVLLPNKDNLGSHSMAIATTREMGVLQSWGLSLSRIYNMPALAKPHAKQLFCWHAFLQPSPPPEFETLVEDFLKACNGLPLSLKVLGAQLHGRKSKDYWKSQLNKILRILPGEIKQRLQVSYDALDKEEREMFLDVACFFIGKEKSKVIAAWDGSDWSGLQGLETLVNKCLVELVEENLFNYDKQRSEVEITIRMHDHLRDMGREIASSHSPYRLWCPQQIDDMKKDSKKRKQIRGIQPADAFVAFKEYTHRLMGNSSRRSKRLRFSNELQILSVKGNEFTEQFASLTEDLVWLHWEGFLQRKLPPWLIFKNLRILELDGADELEELWQDNANPPLQLRELILKRSLKLQWLPSSIIRLQHLKRLYVDFHGSSLSEDLCGLQSLERLQLYAPLLSSLPVGFGTLTRLRNIDMCNCEQLSTLPDSFKQLIHLEVLDLSGCEMLSSLPAGFGNLTSLRNLKMWNCKQLSTLPDSFKQLIHLEVLDLSCCALLASLPAGFGNLTSLRNLYMRNCKQLSTLPESFKDLIHLEHLDLSNCSNLKLRLDVLENIRKLKALNLRNCQELEDLPRQIMNQAFLTDLYLDGCIKSRGVPTSIGELGKLVVLRIETLVWNSWQTSLVNLSSLKRIEFSSSFSLMASNEGAASSLKTLKEADSIEDCKCKHFSRISISNHHFPNLETFVVTGNRQLVEIETLPESLKFIRIENCDLLQNIGCISGLINLEKLEISFCRQIEELPSFADLASLNTFRMWDCPKVEKIQGLEHAKSLKILEVFANWRVACIQSLEKVERLEWLELSCESISAVKPCLQSIKGKEFPREVWIRGSVRCLVEEIVKSLQFVDVDVTEVEKPSDVDGLSCYMDVENDGERKVVSICCRQYGGYSPREKEKVVVGERGRVVETFYQLLELLE